jgi:hypothetical protein
LASKIEKSTNMILKKWFRKKLKKVSKNAEFHADFKSDKKVLKKCTKNVRKYPLFPHLLMLVKLVLFVTFFGAFF